MRVKKRIRKQCFKLTAEDFERFPCWEFALDEEGLPGQDEATARPVPSRRGFDTGYGPLLVLAIFSFINGRVRLGQLTIGAGIDLSGTQPALFLADRQLAFYQGAYPPSKAELKREARLLAAVCVDPFPIYYRTAAHTKRGEPLVAGVIKGFYKYGGSDKPSRRILLS